MIRSLRAACVVLLLAGAACAQSPERIVRDVVLQAREGRVDALDARDGLDTAGRLVMFAGADSTVALVALDDKSPLKAHLPAAAWTALVSQLPRLVDASAKMREALVSEALAGLEAYNLDLPRSAALACEGMLIASGKVDELLEKATLVFSARAMLVLARDARIARKLVMLSIDPRVPAEVRKAAGLTVAIAAGVEVQEAIAEAHLKALIDGNGR